MPNIFVLRQDFDERKTDRIPQDIFFVCLHIYVAEAVVYVLLPNLVRGRLVDGMVSCDLAWVAAGLIPCRISDGCSRITFYRFCMGAVQSSSPYMVRLFYFCFCLTLCHIHRRFEQTRFRLFQALNS